MEATNKNSLIVRMIQLDTPNPAKWPISPPFVFLLGIRTYAQYEWLWNQIPPTPSQGTHDCFIFTIKTKAVCRCCPGVGCHHITTQSKWTTDLSYLASSSFPHSITTPPKQNLLAAFVLIKTNKEATEKKTNRCFFHLLKWYSTRTNQTHLWWFHFILFIALTLLFSFLL